MLPVEDMRSSGSRGAIGAGVTLLGLLLNTLPAHAQADEATTRASARQLGTAGVEAYQAGSYAKASEKLEKAFRILRVPTLGLWSARALKATGNYVQAAERYLDVTRLEASGGDIAVQKRAIVEASTELESLRPKIPSLTIELKGAAAADVSVELDGVAISSDLLGERQPINPGSHSIVIRRGDEQATAQVSLSEGESKTTVLQLKPAEPGASGAPAAVRDAPASSLPASTASPAADSAPKHKASSTRTLGWISLGVGGAGLALGSVTGILALGKRSSIDDSEQCDGDQCYAPERELAESYNSLRTWSSVGFIAGGALAATGVVLLLTSPSSTQASTGRGPSAALWISPQGAAVKGRF
jgi:hypothetical protein